MLQASEGNDGRLRHKMLYLTKVVVQSIEQCKSLTRCAQQFLSTGGSMMTSTVRRGGAPQLLRKHASAIAGGSQRHSPVTIPVERWQRWLGPGKRSAGWSAADINRSVSAFSKGSISRNDLKGLANESDGRSGLREVLVATLAWGMGTANARMMPGLVRLLNHERLQSALQLSAEHAASGDPEAAHVSWVKQRLPGVREPFFTKWLWVASSIAAANVHGEVSGSGLQCLTLDGRVQSSLRTLEWNGVEAARSSRLAKRYEAYVVTCHEWASALTEQDCLVSAEDIEWALFVANGDLSRLRLGKP